MGWIILILISFGLTWYLLRSVKKVRESDTNLTIDDKFNAKKVSKQEELDRILDKISQSGYKSLSRKEKDFLKNF